MHTVKKTVSVMIVLVMVLIGITCHGAAALASETNDIYLVLVAEEEVHPQGGEVPGGNYGETDNTLPDASPYQGTSDPSNGQTPQTPDSLEHEGKKPAPTKAPVYTVRFLDCDGNVLLMVSVEHGTRLEKPDFYPTKEGYEFKYWYNSKDGTDAFRFDTPIMKDMTLRPWVQALPTPEEPEVPEGQTDGVANQEGKQPVQPDKAEHHERDNSGTTGSQGDKSDNRASNGYLDLVLKANNVNAQNTDAGENEDNLSSGDLYEENPPRGEENPVILPDEDGSEGSLPDEDKNEASLADEDGNVENLPVGGQNVENLSSEDGNEASLSGEGGKDTSDVQSTGQNLLAIITPNVTEVVSLGDTIVLTATLHGNESAEYEMVWQCHDGASWAEAQLGGMSYSFILDEENIRWDFRLMVMPTAAHGAEDGGQTLFSNLIRMDSIAALTGVETDGDDADHETFTEFLEKTEPIELPRIVDPAERSISIAVDIGKGNTAELGRTATLSAVLTGYDGYRYTLAWQCDSGSGWQYIGATGPSYSFVLSEENAAWAYRLEVILGD